MLPAVQFQQPVIFRLIYGQMAWLPLDSQRIPMSLAKLWTTLFSAAVAGMILNDVATAVEKLATPWHESSDA
jgi:hypothetical protein